MAWRARPRHARGLLPPVVALLLATSLASSALAADPSPAGAGASPVAVVRVPQDATLAVTLLFTLALAIGLFVLLPLFLAQAAT
ncbi:MAG: hypothetical protein ACHQ02_04510, partial [Candidatus Limnocylindrales bacterium]